MLYPPPPVLCKIMMTARGFPIINNEKYKSSASRLLRRQRDTDHTYAQSSTRANVIKLECNFSLELFPLLMIYTFVEALDSMPTHIRSCPIDTYFLRGPTKSRHNELQGGSVRGANRFLFVTVVAQQLIMS